MLLQPMPGFTDSFLDPTHPKSRPGEVYQEFAIADQVTIAPTSSPYGDIDRWDVLWLGHCGAKFPAGDDEASSPPLARVVISNDKTVPAHHDYDMGWGSSELKDEYPEHTRIVARARDNLCSIAYAVSQQGARRILYELGVRGVHKAFDLELHDFCDGLEGRKMRTCLTVQPELFAQHRRAGSVDAWSDIARPDSGRINEVAFTPNIRWSTRTNFARLLEGRNDYIDWTIDGHR